MEKLHTIRKQGGSRVIAVTDIIPDDWQYVEIKTVKKTDNNITIHIEKVK